MLHPRSLGYKYMYTVLGDTLMNTIWTPDNSPPQLTDIAANILEEQLQQHGIVDEALALLEKEELLMAFLDEFGFELNQASAEGPWPAKTLNIGAAFTLMAYRTAGVHATIDSQAIESGNFLAELYGVPETYVVSSLGDSRLVDMTRKIFSSHIFDESSADARSKGGYEQIGTIGSGCVRHYLQQAVELAA